jgi:hypothetical protein
MTDGAVGRTVPLGVVRKGGNVGHRNLLKHK